MPNIEALLNYKFNISEIFYSIQGEGSRAGLPCVFVRLQGCELRCWWCDTDYALDLKQKAESLSGKEILHKIQLTGIKFVTITGGEPLNQKAVIPLMSLLCDKGYLVALETNGHIDISEVDKRVIKIMDIKCPNSGMAKFNNFNNLKYLDKKDEIKFVVANREDYDFAKKIIQEHKLLEIVDVINLSAVFGKLPEKTLAQWIIKDAFPVRLNLQIHKYIWGPNTRGV